MKRFAWVALLLASAPLFAATNDLTIPVFGKLTLPQVTYRSEVVIANHGDRVQLIDVYLIGRAGVGSGLRDRIGIGAHESMLDTQYLERIVLPFDGAIGALRLIAVNEDGSTDPRGQIEAHVFVIAEHPDGGTTRQEVPEVPSSEYLAESVTLAGIRHDARAYTNVGIVNLAPSTEGFWVFVDDRYFEVEVPGLTSMQMRLPYESTARRSVTIRPFWTNSLIDPPAIPKPWVAYASTVDGVTGDAWTAYRLIEDSYLQYSRASSAPASKAPLP